MKRKDRVPPPAEPLRNNQVLEEWRKAYGRPVLRALAKVLGCSRARQGQRGRGDTATLGLERRGPPVPERHPV